MKRLIQRKWVNTLRPVLGLAAAVALSRAGGQPLTVLHAFPALQNGTNVDGAQPQAGLVLSGGWLYGAAPTGGANSNGTLFALPVDGSAFTVLHTFALGGYTNFDGESPEGGLRLSGNTLFGTALYGGNQANGTVFSIDTNGNSFSVIKRAGFPMASGSHPRGGLAVAGGTLYGTMGVASTGFGDTSSGTVFSIRSDGSGFSTVYTLSNLLSNSEVPFQMAGGLVLATNTLYGATQKGGTNGGYGMIFSVNTNGTGFAVLHSFTGVLDGATPLGFLLLSGDTLYGTTSSSSGGFFYVGSVFSLNRDGTGFRVIHAFNSTTPVAAQGGLVLFGNTLVGTTRYGGAYDYGTVFAVNTDGSRYTVWHDFTGGVDGAWPANGPLVRKGDRLYGATTGRGAGGSGTVFSLAIVPSIISLSFAGSDVVLDVANGVAGHAYVALKGASLMTPLGQWPPVATNTLSGDGDFTMTVPNGFVPGVTQQFYAIQKQ